MTRDARTVEWLLESDEPAVRHAALVGLLDRPADDPDVRDARAAMMQADPIRGILAHQQAAGHWDRPAGFYYRKYRGTVWPVIFLAQLGADPGDERIHRACEFLFRRSQNCNTGGFAISSSREGSGGGIRCLPCLTGNLVRALLHFGYTGDERWQRAVEWLLAEQHEDGGWSHGADGTHSCFQGSIKPMMALTAIPPAQRSPAMRQAIGRAAEFFLQHRLFRRDHHGFSVAKPGFLQLRFPLGWQTDVLEMLDGVTAAGILDDPRLADALDVVISKRREDGRWLLDETFGTSGAGSTWCAIETKGRSSKWITLRALRVLRRIKGHMKGADGAAV